MPLSLGLAATAFFLWCLVGSFGVRIGISLQEFGLVAGLALGGITLYRQELIAEE